MTSQPPPQERQAAALNLNALLTATHHDDGVAVGKILSAMTAQDRLDVLAVALGVMLAGLEHVSARVGRSVDDLLVDHGLFISGERDEEEG